MSKRRMSGSASENFDSLSDQAFVRIAVVAELYSVSVSTVWRWVRSDIIPQPMKLGPQTTVWNVGELRRSLRSYGLE